MIQNLIIYQLILISLILSIKAQLKWNFEIEDSEENNIPTIDSNLRSTFEIPTENEMEFKTVINVCLGTKPQCFNLGVQTNTFYIWVHSFNSRETNSDSKINVFDYTKSTTIQRNNNFFKKILFGRRIIGFEARDILTINGKDYSKINFLILESSESLRMIDGFIGLGYTPNNDERKFSIILQLFENGVIPHKVFSQKYYTPQKGLLTIGEIPKNIIKDYTHYGRCSALDKVIDGKRYKNNNWECKIDSIYYGDNEKNKIPIPGNKEQRMSFLSYRKRSFVPFEIFEQIGKTYLKKEIKEGKCTVKHELRYSFYECDSDISIQNITFVFGDWEFKVNSKDLFNLNKEGNKKQLILYHKDNFEVFLLGRSILKGFEMVYDYANKQIGFYHESVTYKGSLKVEPPKIFEFLEDEEEFQPKTIKDEHQAVFPEAKPEEVRIKNTEDVEENIIYQITDIIKNILSILILIVIIIIALAIIIYSRKYAKKEKIKKANKYLQEEMISKENEEK